MTGYDVYRRACAILFESAGEDVFFKKSAPALLNLLISEALPYQQSRERADGRELTEAFEIKALENEIPLDFPIVAHALPFGLAAYFYQDEEDNYRAQDFRGRFITALEEAKKLSESGILDLYGSEA